MGNIDIIDLKKTILEDNDADAAVLREDLKSKGLFYVNIMSSPGSGKTTTLLSTIKLLKDDLRIGVMEADIDSDVDAKKIADAGIPAVQLHTGGMCHLDADMSRQGMKALGCEELDVVFLENVGNLVCPAEFDTGAHMNVVILSVPEGHDKPLKYPLIFETCEAVIINKIDAMPAFNFSLEKVTEYVKARNPEIKVFPISAKTGEGVKEWCDYLKNRVRG